MRLTSKNKAKKFLKRLDGKIVLKKRLPVVKIVEKSSGLTLEKVNSLIENKVKSIKIPEQKVERIEIIKPEVRTEVRTEVKEIVKLDDKKVEELRTEFLSHLANVRGGNANRQIRVGGTEVSTKYTDINLIGGDNVTITTADDNTNKRVDITLDSSTLDIGDVITGGTQGSVLFVGTSSVLAQDNANFFWDDTNNRLRLGTNPSTTGVLNLPNAIWISGRNAANSADVLVIRVSSLDGVEMGLAGSFIFNTAGHFVTPAAFDNTYDIGAIGNRGCKGIH